jgi:plastocyanin
MPTSLRRPLVAGAVIVGLVAAAPAAGQEAAPPQLKGTTGTSGFKITLKRNGVLVEKTSVPAGTYTVIIRDASNQHEWGIRGNGQSREITNLPFVGTKSAKVTLTRGTYTYLCERHESLGMKRTFTVT